jgi:predicted NAD/FAD-binding protein
MKIAVIGGGAAGLTAAWLLQKKHQVTLFEKNKVLGGHTRTIEVTRGPDAGTPVDTGFIVMNHRNYPLFTRVLEKLDVPLADSDMSFGYHCEETGYAYAGTNLRSLFARSRNWFDPAHWSMLRDILRFNRTAREDLDGNRLNGETLNEYLEQGAFGKPFAERYLLAMGSAIWSSPHADIGSFPARSFISFFANHGLLSIDDRPQWRYVKGGSRQYIHSMLKTLGQDAHASCPARGIARTPSGVQVRLEDGSTHLFDRVVVATHADEAIALLEDPTRDEQQHLGAWTYQANEAVLHSDPQVMPRARHAHASWNFTREVGMEAARAVSITYDMNRLQRLETKSRYYVTLNRGGVIAEDLVVDRTTFMHPLYNKESMASQPQLKKLNEEGNTLFCGSYFGYGFHEDAVRSAVNVADLLGITL